MKIYDAVILGAGAAGLFCAMRAAQLGKSVLVLEKTDRVGSKILISGGGRCNFTNRIVLPERFLSENKHFCRSALSFYTPEDFIALLTKHAVSYHEKTLGQLFCDGSAQQIVDLLLTECRDAGVEINLARDVSAVRKTDLFEIDTQHETLTAPCLVLATGGLSIPKMGASGLSYELATQFGLSLVQTRPALVPLVFENKFLEVMRELAGVSLPVKASKDKASFEESMIFTHRGLSGPAILQISSYWKESQSVHLDLLPDLDAGSFLIERKKSRAKAELKTVLAEVLPSRLADSLATDLFSNAPISHFSDKALLEVASVLKNWTVTPTGSEGYAKAEVTLGGVSTDQLSSKTLEAKSVSGLFVIGEAVDVTGWLGGYNFQWAWSSGWAAGSALGARTA